MRFAAGSALMLLVAWDVTGCRSPPSDVPADTYRAFVAALNQGDGPGAWGLLSHETQAELTKEVQAVAKARGQREPPEAWPTVFGERYMSQRDIKTATVTSNADGRATLLVEDDKGGQQTIKLVREGDRWAIDLTSEIHDAIHQ